MNNSIKTIIILSACILILGFTYNKWQYAEQEKQDALNQLELINKSYEKVYNDLNEIHDLNLQLQKRVTQINNDLEKMKGRSEVVAAKPELVEIMINTSYDEFERGLLCVTGSYSHCQ